MHVHREPPYTGEGLFVCFDVVQCSPIHLKAGETRDFDGQHVTYKNIKIYFHSYYAKKSTEAFKIVSEYMCFRNYGVKGSPYELHYFLSEWNDGPALNIHQLYGFKGNKKLPPVKGITFKELKDKLIGQNAYLHYTVTKRGERTVTFIDTIEPWNDECYKKHPKNFRKLYVNPLLEVDPKLYPSDMAGAEEGEEKRGLGFAEDESVVLTGPGISNHTIDRDLDNTEMEALPERAAGL